MQTELLRDMPPSMKGHFLFISAAADAGTVVSIALKLLPVTSDNSGEARAMMDWVTLAIDLLKQGSHHNEPAKVAVKAFENIAQAFKQSWDRKLCVPLNLRD